MTGLSLILYLFSLASGLVIIGFALRLNRRYQKKFLSQYFFFLVAYYIYIFISRVCQHISHEFFQGDTVASHQVAHYSVVLLGLPFFLASLYFFISFSHEITDRTLSNLFTIWYFILSFAVLVLVLAGINLLIYNRNHRFIENTLTWIRLGIISVFFLCSLKIFRDSRGVLPHKKRSGLGVLSVLYAVLFLFCFCQSGYRPMAQAGIFRFTLVVFYPFLLNFLPLLYLRIFLREVYVTQSLRTDEHENLNHFYLRFNMSRQEKVIIEFVLQGMTSQTIAGKLSISTGTVKNHLYNIYRKTGVNSRHKLIQMVREFAKGGRSPDLIIK